jgi:hypothetical protein
VQAAVLEQVQEEAREEVMNEPVAVEPELEGTPFSSYPNFAELAEEQARQVREAQARMQFAQSQQQFAQPQQQFAQPVHTSPLLHASAGPSQSFERTSFPQQERVPSAGAQPVGVSFDEVPQPIVAPAPKPVPQGPRRVSFLERVKLYKNKGQE